MLIDTQKRGLSAYLLVYSGFHSLRLQYAEKPTLTRERFAIFGESNFICGRLNILTNKANALVCYYVTETLLCDPVLRHGLDGFSLCTQNCVQRYTKFLTYANNFAYLKQNGGKNATVMRFYPQFCVKV